MAVDVLCFFCLSVLRSPVGRDRGAMSTSRNGFVRQWQGDLLFPTSDRPRSASQVQLQSTAEMGDEEFRSLQPATARKWRLLSRGALTTVVACSTPSLSAPLLLNARREACPHPWADEARLTMGAPPSMDRSASVINSRP